jgi:hypothetical protein
MTFTVIEPDGVMIEQEPGTGIYHIQGMPSRGFKGRPYIQPDTVSFDNIRVSEGYTTAVCIGYFAFAQGQAHPPTNWFDVSGTVSAGKGSKADTIDTIWYEFTSWPPPHTNGTFTWQIPWHYRVGGGSAHEFSTVDQVHTVDGAGTLTSSKGGTTRSSALNDPTSTY